VSAPTRGARRCLSPGEPPSPQLTSGPLMPVADVAPDGSSGFAEYVLPAMTANESRPWPVGNDDRLSTPGATRSSCAPVFENDARLLFRSIAPTVSTFWYAPGYETLNV